MDTDYTKVAMDALIKYSALVAQKEELEIEIAKVNHFLLATISLLPDDQHERYLAMIGTIGSGPAGLGDAIRQALKRRPRWFTVTQVRDELLQSKFDFSGYTTNPLASVSTTLRRMKDAEIQKATNKSRGVTMYRWKAQGSNGGPLGKSRPDAHADIRQILSQHGIPMKKD
jgi:hypothetical protein